MTKRQALIIKTYRMVSWQGRSKAIACWFCFKPLLTTYSVFICPASMIVDCPWQIEPTSLRNQPQLWTFFAVFHPKIENDNFSSNYWDTIVDYTRRGELISTP